jgi:hypothetical protein
VQETQARRAEEGVPEAVAITWPPSEADDAIETEPEAPELPQPIPLRPARNKRAWFSLQFLRKAS